MGVARDMAAKPEPRLVDNRNRIALTKVALDALGVESGDYVVLEVEDDGSVRLRRARIVVE